MLNDVPTSDKIRYRLVETPIRKDEKPCYAARVIVDPMSLRQIAAQMVREGSKYAEHEIVGMAEQMIDVIMHQLRNGRSVNFGSVMRFRPSIKGCFHAKDEPFNPKVHQLRLAVSAGRLMKHALEGVAVECADQEKLPEIRSVVVEHPGATHLVKVIGTHLYQKNLGSGASWWIRTANTQYPITEVVQKRTGRSVTFLLPQSTFPIGTEATFVLKVKENEFCSAPIRL